MFVQNSETFEPSNESMVCGLVDYMSTLVSGGGTAASPRGWLETPPPLPPKVNRGSSVDRAMSSYQPKPVRIVGILSKLLYLTPVSINIDI